MEEIFQRSLICWHLCNLIVFDGKVSTFKMMKNQFAKLFHQFKGTDKENKLMNS